MARSANAVCGHIVAAPMSLPWSYMVPMHQILEEIKHTYRAPSASIFRDDTVVKDPHSKENPNTPSEQLNVANSNIPDSPKDAAGATEMRGSSTKSFLSRAGLQLAEYDDRLHNSVFERIPKRFRMIAVALSLAIANCLVSMVYKSPSS